MPPWRLSAVFQCRLMTPDFAGLQEKRICTSQLVHHPWLSLPLSPEQQLAWEALQDEQQKLTDQLEAERDPRLVSCPLTSQQQLCCGIEQQRGLVWSLHMAVIALRLQQLSPE
jgi:hypothetical protein